MHSSLTLALMLAGCAIAAAQDSTPPSQPEAPTEVQPESGPLPAEPINYAALRNAQFLAIPDAERAWPVYAELQAILAPRLRELRPLQTAKPGDDDWDQATALLDQMPQLLPLIEELQAKPNLAWIWADALPAEWVRALRGPDVTPPEPSPNPRLTDIALPYVNTIRAAGTCIRLEALRAAEAGNIDRAIEILENAPIMARHLEETRVVATCIGAIALQGGVIVEGVIQLTDLAGDSLTPAQLDRLDALLESVTHQKFTTDLIADERSIFADAIDNIYNEIDPLGDPQISVAGAGKLMTLAGSTIPPDLDPATDIPEENKQAAIQRFRTMALSYEESYDAWQRAWDTVTAEASQPVWTWTAAPGLESLRAESAAAAENNRTLPYMLFVSSYHRIAEFCELLRVQTDAARVAVALQRYHNQHDAWPESLDALVPDALPVIPADWVDGQPLRYTLSEEGQPALYSIGPDGDDDNAKPLPQGAGERYVYPSQREARPQVIPDGDWVLWPGT